MVDVEFDENKVPVDDLLDLRIGERPHGHLCACNSTVSHAVDEDEFPLGARSSARLLHQLRRAARRMRRFGRCTELRRVGETRLVPEISDRNQDCVARRRIPFCGRDAKEVSVEVHFDLLDAIQPYQGLLHRLRSSHSRLAAAPALHAIHLEDQLARGQRTGGHSDEGYDGAESHCIFLSARRRHIGSPASRSLGLETETDPYGGVVLALLGELGLGAVPEVVLQI